MERIIPVSTGMLCLNSCDSVSMMKMILQYLNAIVYHAIDDRSYVFVPIKNIHLGSISALVF